MVAVLEQASFTASLRLIFPLAAAHQRAGVVASIYVVSYLAFGVPVVVAGQLASPFGLVPTVFWYTTVTGQFQVKLHALGAWRWPALALAFGLVAIVLGVPVVFALLGTFMKLFGFFNVPEPWTLDNWRTVLSDELFASSLRNSATASGFQAIFVSKSRPGERSR